MREELAQAGSQSAMAQGLECGLEWLLIWLTALIETVIA